MPPLLPSVAGVCGNGLTHCSYVVFGGSEALLCNRKVTDLRFAACGHVTVMLKLLLAAREETCFSVLTFKVEFST